MKKALLTLVAVIVIVTMLAAPAFAATYNLGAFDAPGGHSYWYTDGTDDITSGLTADMLKNGTEIRIEFKEELEGDIQFVFMGDGNNWSWKQFDGVFGPEDGTTFVIKFSDYPGLIEAASGEDGLVKIALGYWSGDLSTLISSATLVYSGGGGGGGARPTGDNTMIALAIVALTLAGGATVFFLRRVKA